MGQSAGRLNILGGDDTYIGYHAGYNSVSSFNTFIGDSAAADFAGSGEDNICIGYQCGRGDRKYTK
jgi:hypothetical protein